MTRQEQLSTDVHEGEFYRSMLTQKISIYLHCV